MCVLQKSLPKLKVRFEPMFDCYIYIFIYKYMFQDGLYIGVFKHQAGQNITTKPPRKWWWFSKGIPSKVPKTFRVRKYSNLPRSRSLQVFPKEIFKPSFQPLGPLPRWGKMAC